MILSKTWHPSHWKKLPPTPDQDPLVERPGCNPRYCQQEEKNLGLEPVSRAGEGWLGGNSEMPQKSLPHPQLRAIIFGYISRHQVILGLKESQIIAF